MADRPFNVLFLCTGNSARSIIAEGILNRVGDGRFRAYSAGSRPKAEVNPRAIELLESLGYDTSAFRSKSWSEFATPGAPPLDFVFTVCDNAAGETCPVWPGQPMTAHWGIPDPAAAAGSAAEVALAFKDAYRMLFQRIGAFTALPIRSLDTLSLQNRLKDIGRMEGATARANAVHNYMDVIIYHNPDCGTSRNTLGLIRNAGVEPHVIEYLTCPPSRVLLRQLIERMRVPVRAVLREKGTPFHDLGLADPMLSDDQLLDVMMAHPILINRPIVVTPQGVRLCRPSERVIDLLPPQRGEFRKEDGELIVDAAGRPVAPA